MTDLSYDKATDGEAGTSPECLNTNPAKEGFTMSNQPVSIRTPETQEAHLPADPIISMIERVAMDPNSDLEKLEKMLELKERHEDREDARLASQAEKEFNRALAACQAEMPVVGKNSKNKHTGTTYTDLAGLMDVVRPVIAKHGFAVQFNPGKSDSANEIAVDWAMSHSGGHVRRDTAHFPIDASGTGGKTNKTAIQAQQSSRTYARRYLMVDLFNIATSDDTDGNAPVAAPQTVSADQYVQLRDKAEQAGVDEAKICLAAGVSDLHQFPANHFDAAIKRLDRNMGAKKDA